MKSNRRCLSVALLCSAITFAGLPARAQQYTSDGAVRPDRALSPEETNPGPVLSPGAVRPDRALSPEETDPGPVLSPNLSSCTPICCAVLSPDAVPRDRALSPEETNPPPVLSPGAVRPDPALPPD